MGETVYVLMGLEGNGKVKEWRPIAVVSNPDVATQWIEYGKNVDWVPLELDDVKNISPGNMPTFQPRETTPGEAKALELQQKMEATINRMQKMIDDQAAVIKKLMKGKTGAERVTILPKEPHPTAKSPYEYDSDMLEDVKPIAEDPHNPVPSWVTGAAEDKIPPKPTGFADKLDARGLADYIETYATYEWTTSSCTSTSKAHTPSSSWFP